VCGTYIVPEVFPILGDVFARGSKVLHIAPGFARL
jgi:hypothetical protein